MLEIARNDETIKGLTAGLNVVKVIAVPGRLNYSRKAENPGKDNNGRKTKIF